MTDPKSIEVIVACAEEAYDGIADFWCGPDLTCIADGCLELRVESRKDSLPCRVDPASLAEGLAKAAELLAAH